MTLGTFHFAYPNLDRVKTADEDKINMMSPERQKEIRQLVKQIATFKSTKIIIEEKTWRQAYMDSLYAEYLNNSFTLPIAEQYQIAFRLGKLLGLSKIYCVDTWGNVNFFAGWDGKSNFAIRAGKEEFMQKLEIYSDSLIALRESERSFENDQPYQSLQSILVEMNSEETIKKSSSQVFSGTLPF